MRLKYPIIPYLLISSLSITAAYFIGFNLLVLILIDPIIIWYFSLLIYLWFYLAFYSYSSLIIYFNSMGYIVAFLTISSILIDVCFTNLIFIGAIFNSYNYWYLLSYSNQFTLHYSILFLIISIIIIPLIYCYFSYYIKIIIYLLKYIGKAFLLIDKLLNGFHVVFLIRFYILLIFLIL